MEEAQNTRAAQLLHRLGSAIVAGDPYRPGDVLNLDTIMEQKVYGFPVSRALARQVLQALHQKRLVKLRPRVAAAVLPAEKWDVFDQDVICWRLRSGAGSHQMDSLTEVREAIEPKAANLAAKRAAPEVCRDLVSLSRQLMRLGMAKEAFAGGKEHRDKYEAVDERFHEVLLRGSQNDMFQAWIDPVKEALKFRLNENWEGTVPSGTRSAAVSDTSAFPRSPRSASLWLHFGLAYAVNQRQPEAAETFSRAVIAELSVTPLPPVLPILLHRALDQVQPDGMHGAEFEQLSFEVQKFCRDRANNK